MLAVTPLNGAPTLLLVYGIGHFDAFGRRVITVTVPPGYSGLELTIQAFALSSSGTLLATSHEDLFLD